LVNITSSSNLRLNNGPYNGRISDWSGGECVFWELCGREEFLASYHYVLTFQQPAVHLITVSLREPLTVQLQQMKFWLQFILDRINPSNVGKILAHASLNLSLMQ